MRVFQADLLVIGSGCAGLMAAVAAASAGASVIITDKGLAGKSGCTVSAQQLAAVIPCEAGGDSTEAHYLDTLRAGKNINDPRLARIMVEQAEHLVYCLENLGLSLERTDNGKLSKMAMNGHSYARSLYQSDITGKIIIDVLRTRAEFLGVQMKSDVFVASLLTSGNKVTGAAGIDFTSGEAILFGAGAVIIASGGAGQLYSRTTNSVQATGEGLVLALRAGAILKDLEFFQFYPAAVISPQVLRGYCVGMAQFGKLYNRQNERFMARYDPEAMEGATRDKLAFAIYSEIRSGNCTTDGGVYLDVAGLEKEIYDAFAAEVDYCKRLGVDIRHERLEVCPAAHYLMGGIKIDGHCRTAVDGLYAAGEAAGGIHGANRLGNNSLTDAVVFGALAGNAAASFASQKTNDPPEKELGERVIARMLAPAERGTMKYTPEQIKTELQQVMWQHAGIIRDGDGLANALDKLGMLEEKLSETGVSSGNLIFNRQLSEIVETANMILLARASIVSALMRTESRGAHFREDFPLIDDSNWLVNTEICLHNGRIAFSHRPAQSDGTEGFVK